ncbi:MAG: pyridoxal phosphate-dependent aminotransferase [Lachnospiraceae bacterium]|nr:pyridoxal phosphate-dependent aminotransferase [Lachnospiraceae bacterium]
MISQKYKDMLQAKSVIRNLSEYATKRGKEIGYENVFDYSLGNPSVPVPDAYAQAVKRLHDELSSSALHGYSPSLGHPTFKAAVAASLSRRFGVAYTPELIFPTSGAAGAIAHALRAVTVPGEEVITFAPYFPEYNQYVNQTGAILKVVPADTATFQINFEALEAMISEKTGAILINTPNNPSGIVYSEETITRLADVLTRKSTEYGRDIFLISDEPYREIMFDQAACPYVSKYYKNTLSCYSYSKSLSLPGERIGYVAVNPECVDAAYLVPMMGQISRGIGHNCPSSTIQLAVSEILDMTCDMSVYERNMNLLYDKLTELGFTCVRPGGTFYIFPRALEEDAVAFCQKALNYDLILVPSDSFGVPGYFRMAYCIDTEKVERSLAALEAFVKNEYPN